MSRFAHTIIIEFLRSLVIAVYLFMVIIKPRNTQIVTSG